MTAQAATVQYWLIEASKDGIVFEPDTWCHGLNQKQVEELAAQMQEAHPEGWKPEVVFEPKRATPADRIELMLA